MPALRETAEAEYEFDSRTNKGVIRTHGDQIICLLDHQVFFTFFQKKKFRYASNLLIQQCFHRERRWRRLTRLSDRDGSVTEQCV